MYIHARRSKNPHGYTPSIIFRILAVVFLVSLVAVGFGCKRSETAEGSGGEAAGAGLAGSADGRTLESGQQRSTGSDRDKPDGVTGPSVQSIAVFIPGLVEGSPTYEMLVAGVRQAVDKAGEVSLKIVEGGYNQGEWQDKITSLASTGEYDLIVTSNPSMPEICAEVTKVFPEQYFLVLDGHLSGNDRIFTFLFNQMEQSFLSGYYAGMLTGSGMTGTNPEKVVGLIIAQEYPMMNRVIRPGFELGLNQADGEIIVDYRVIGNWYDASKAAELTEASIAAGADIILTIAGGAGQGVLSAAARAGRYVLWFDDNGFDLASDVVLGCAILRLDLAAFETVGRAIRGTLPYGRAETAGVADGYVDFLIESEGAASTVPETIQQRQREMLEKIRNGGFNLPVPVL